MDKLGIEPSLLVAQIINFLIIVFVLTKLLYKPILQALEKRRHEIEEGLALTEKMRIEDEKLKERRAKLLDQARSEASAIIAEAKKRAKAEEAAILTEAQQEAKEIVEKGKADAVREKEDMQKSLRESSVRLAIAMSKRLLASVLTEGDKEKILDKHVKELESVRMS